MVSPESKASFGTSPRSQQRAYVIERSINVEWIINGIISQHYFKYVQTNFLFEVLYDEQFSFGLRRRILEKISSLDSTFFNKLGRLNTIRNFFAHCNQEVVDRTGTNETIVPNPRKPNEGIDFDKLFTEFEAIAGEIERTLAAEYTRKGGVLVPHVSRP